MKMNYYEEALKLHEKHQGKIHTELNCEINTMDDMSVVYTPGVAEPCRKIAENEEDVYRYTTKSNTIAVVSNGTAVLGLGNIGAKASIPVMEGKAALFKKFGDVNAVPICLDTQDKEELIQTVKNIAPCFGGINLEDIASPDCFEIEERLDQMLDIPVFHDDQHGTAVVVGVSKPNLVTDEMVHSMNNDPIIFAMANPEPEITYQKAKAAGARVVGTGRSDYPNQINNVLAFPGIFKGALEARVPSITPEMKVAVAKAIADTISDEDLNEENIMPKIFNKDVTAAVANAIKQFAK